MPEPDAEAKLSFEYDEEQDILTIEGIRYTGDLFREWSDGGMEVGQLFQITARPGDGTLGIQRIASE